MIIITGSVQARPDTVDELIRLSLQHVRRSRAEGGCLSHDVHRDVEDDHRLVFVERWADHESVRAHFSVPESAAFVKAATALAAAPPSMQLYEAQETTA